MRFSISRPRSLIGAKSGGAMGAPGAAFKPFSGPHQSVTWRTSPGSR